MICPPGWKSCDGSIVWALPFLTFTIEPREGGVLWAWAEEPDGHVLSHRGFLPGEMTLGEAIGWCRGVLSMANHPGVSDMLSQARRQRRDIEGAVLTRGDITPWQSEIARLRGLPWKPGALDLGRLFVDAFNDGPGRYRPGPWVLTREVGPFRANRIGMADPAYTEALGGAVTDFWADGRSARVPLDALTEPRPE